MIAGIVTKSGVTYRVKTRQGIACLFLERENQEADADNIDNPEEK